MADGKSIKKQKIKAMTTIDFNKQAEDWKGAPATYLDGEKKEQPIIFAEQLGQQLAYSSEKDGNKLAKYWDWAKLLGKGKPLVLDNADKNTLKQFVEASDLFTWVKRQIIEIIENAKEEK